jgi:tetratricopeptide (TPR) repeat protein
MSDNRARAIFVELVAQVPAEQWDDRLAELARDDQELRAKVAALLAAHRQADSFLEHPAAALGETVDAPGVVEPRGALDAPPECAGAVLAGRYKLLEAIGEGGMGTVWMAQQTEPVKRLVAVKLIKPGMDSKPVLARFEAERQALALMDHPHIARVFDAGVTTTGRPYFVMELVKGQPLTHYCDEHRLTPRQRLELFVPVCQAIQHAHQKGIIHRDIKPSNVLVALYDGKPVPKVIDFGIAKATGQQLTEHTLVTGFGAVIGTLEYMSPEQAERNQLDIDTRSDIYSLGVLLYELLTGTTPLERKRLKEAAILELLRLIREEEPPRPSTRLSESKDSLPSISAQRQMEPAKLTKLVRGELDWIVMKALDKDRNRRYETANGFAMDVQRYLADEPVLACPPSAWYRCRKFARRNKAALAVAAGLVLALTVIAGTVGWAVRDRAVREAEIERQQEARRAALEREVVQALEETATFCRADHLPGALAAVKRAEGLLAGGAGSAELLRRVERVKTEVKMAARLEEIRMERTAVKDGHWDDAFANLGYENAFRDYGLDVAAAPDAAAEQIRAAVIRDQLVAALHDWLLVKAQLDAPADERLLAVLGQADADTWRTRFRDAFRRRDRPKLQELARAPEVLDQLPATLVLLANALTGVGEQPLALALLRSAQQRYPNDFWINHNLALGLVLSQPAQPGMAVGYYRAALALRSDSPGVYTNLGVALRKSGDLVEAITAHQRAIALKPDYVNAHLNLGYALKAKGQLDEAIAAYREAIRLKKDYAESHFNFGVALQAKGLMDDAIAAYREAIRLKENHAHAHNNLGSALKSKGQLDEAIAAYREAIRFKKHDAMHHFNLGYALHHKGQLDEAIAAYREAIRLKKDYASAHNNLGTALHAKGQLDEAIAAFREAICFKKDDAESHFNVGVTLEAKGLLDEAIAAYREAIRLQKNHAHAHHNLGSALKAKGQLDEAIAAYREAIRFKKEDVKHHYNLGVALNARGLVEDAISAYREAIRIKEDHAEAHCNLGAALREQGKFREALEALRRGHELGSRTPGWRYPSAQWLRHFERLVELDEQLPGFLDGKSTPASPAERIELAELCSLKCLHRAVARFYAEAFAVQPKLADTPGAVHRYNAACAAALAGCGQGRDADPLDAKERARLRQQALDWLRADLQAWRRSCEKEPDKFRPVIVQQMRHWLADTDFAGVRGPQALAKLPEAERQPWHKLWDDIADELARAQAKTSPQKK